MNEGVGTLDLKHIAERRKLPGLLIFDKSDGHVLFRNPLVDSNVLDKRKYRDWIVKQFNILPASPKSQSEEQVEDDPSMELVVKTVICSDKQYYAISAFTLANEPQDPTVVAVLVEEISNKRLDLCRLRGSFHFTPRETEVINELQFGRTDKMIANELKISPETVRGYVKSIRGKLGVSTRTAIIYKLHAF